MHIHYTVIIAFGVGCATTEPADPVEPVSHGQTTAHVDTTTLPPTLDRQLIENGIEPVRANVLACRNRASERGIVTILVTVAPEGQVTDSHAIHSIHDRRALDGSALGDCTAQTLTSATFAATQHGGSFAFPFKTSDFAD
jgi:hypothetical protein